TILFHALSKKELRSIVTIQLKRIYRLLADQKISLEMSEAAIDHVADAGYDPAYGARPLKRAIQRELENPIATLILEGSFSEGSTLTVDINKKASELKFGIKPPEAEPEPVAEKADDMKEEAMAVSE
ncbi:MAG: ATP-dependent chaperone ClpB, partial [Cyanobacteria bacterium J06623_4]